MAHQTKLDGRKGCRFGGEKAWRQHRDAGENANVVVRNAASERFHREQMLDDHDGEVSFAAAAAEVDPATVIFESNDALGFETEDVRVTLHYGADGKIAAAFCEDLRSHY